MAVAKSAGAQDTTAVDTVPAAFGTLRQDEIAIRLDTRSVQFRILPMSEAIITLMAPDSYGPLHRLRQTRAPAIADAAGRMGVAAPGVFLVTVFGVQDQAPFDPEQLTITSANRFFRPMAILPLSPLWNQHRLTQRETATAIFVYEDGIDLFEALRVEYAGVVSDQWTQTLPLVERERARVAARAAQQRRP
jgi:hypothetical protein